MISVIHNTYERNIHIRESATLNIKALEESGFDYQYIIFNDKGDEGIFEDVKDLLSDKVEYHYSDFNYGMGICSGGWVGAIPLLKGEYIHNIGQDDVYTSMFYKALGRHLENPNVYLAYCNGFKVNSHLSLLGETLGPLQHMDYSNPKEVFNIWFGREGDTLTRANNFIPAPGVVYKKELHDIIGEPDLKTFKGAGDFEYWARVLFNGLGVVYEPNLYWLYRMSEYSLGSKPEAGDQISGWTKLIIQKYQKCLMQSSQEEQAS
jgi:hypothetical protein